MEGRAAVREKIILFKAVIAIFNKLQQIGEKMATQQEQLDALATETEALSTQVTQNNASILTVDTEVKAIQAKLASGGIVTPDDFTKINTALADLTGAVSVNTQGVGTLSTDAAPPAAPTT